MITLSTLKRTTRSPYPIHLALGHERIAAAVSTISSSSDLFSLTHRNIHFNLALTDSSRRQEIFDEALGLSSGINNGNYGCMTLRNADNGVIYTSSILANNISVGLGVSSSLSASSGICWIQVGDGSIEEGAFYESLVFAVARKLPILFILENNNWSLGTSISERRSSLNISKLAESIGFDYFSCPLCSSTFDLLSVLSSARKLVRQGRICLVEFEVLTQGGFFDPSRGYISYHHGPLN